MCGRTACTLAPDDVCRACGYKSKQGKWLQPKWKDAPGGQKYYSSYNVAPGSHTPVLLPKRFFDSKTTKTTEKLEETELEQPMESDIVQEEKEGECVEEECAWVVQPMHWGLVPSWNQGDSKSVGYSMINARSESMLTKRTFKIPLEKGRRCVVLVDGYFEWQTGPDGKKQPHFLYFPYTDSDTVDQLNKEAETEGEEARVFTRRRLLTLAGLFDVWHPKNGDPDLYSYSIITVDSHKQMSWLHSRMPAILDGEEEVRAWLDTGAVPLKKAVELIRPTSNIHHHPVSSVVGNVKNKSEECVKPIDLEQEKSKKTGASSSLMKSWLAKGKKRSADDMSESPKEEKSSQSQSSPQETPEEEAPEDDTPSPEKKSRLSDEEA